MSDEKMIRERLELIKKYMYEELNRLKTRIAEENYWKDHTGRTAGEYSDSDLYMNKCKTAGWKKSGKKLHRAAMHRKYKRNSFNWST